MRAVLVVDGIWYGDPFTVKRTSALWVRFRDAETPVGGRVDMGVVYELVERDPAPRVFAPDPARGVELDRQLRAAIPHFTTSDEETP